jgi:N-acetylmuramoyl-L-alanine amidase
MRKTSLIFVLAFLFTIPVVSVVHAETVHNVKKGDTLWGMSQEYGVSLSDIRTANNKWDDLILVGQQFTIPTEGTAPSAQASQSASSKEAATQSQSKPKAPEAKPAQQASKASSYEADLLSRLVRAEAQGESYSGKLAVAQVVMNRTVSGQFPSSVEGVIYQSGQFSPVSNGSINRAADSDSIRAANAAIAQGGDPNGALFFYNPKTATQSWNSTRPVVNQIGNHVFTR